ncbi:DUF2066 domain-containing protein [Sinobacterium caligoides]|nr:DUF2066 domain-containing protein [Sinobacterium caligoides]
MLKGVKASMLLVLAVMTLVLWATGATAAPVNGLLDASVVVADQSTENRQQALKKLLGDVLVRYSGSTKVLANGAVKAALLKPQHYLNQYQYKLVDDAEGATQTLLVADFQARPINDLLRREQLPVWSANRPSIVLWVVIDDDTGRKIVSDSNRPAFAAALKENAVRRGLPVSLPIYDMSDLMQVSSDDVWQVQQQEIAKASKRYDADALLVGRVIATAEGGWRSSWSLSSGELRTSFSSEGRDFSALLAPVIDQTAEQLSRQYAIVAGVDSGEQLQLSVSGLDSFADYSAAMLYLRSVAVVKSLTPILVHGDSAVFALKLSGSEEQLWQAIALSNQLQAVAAALQPPAQPKPQLAPVASGADASLAVEPTAVQKRLIAPVRYLRWR